MTTPPMFTVTPPPPPELSRMFAPLGTIKGTYSRYKPKHRVPCDECVAVLHEAHGVGSAPLGARVTRRASGVRTLRLCGPHAERWRARDDL
jgi:hypothetical protein